MNFKRAIKIISAILIINTFSVSCSKSRAKRVNIISYNTFAKDIQLTGDPIDAIKEDIFPVNMGLLDDKIIFCDFQSDPHFYIYKLPEFSFIGSFGKQGKGPLNIHDPVFWGQINDNKIGIYQVNLMKFAFYDFDKLINESIKEKDIEPTYMPPEINDAVNIITLKENTFIGSGVNASGEFFIYNSENKTLRWKPFIVDFDDSFMDNLRGFDIISDYKRGVIKAKPDKSMFVKIYNYVPYLDVFDADGHLLFTISPENYTKPKLNKKQQQIDVSSNLFYTNCFLTDNYIYALNRNCKLEAFGNDDCNNVELHVFDWKGNAVKKYSLNEGIGPLSPFVVDEKYNYLYTVNPKDEDSYFTKFKL